MDKYFFNLFLHWNSIVRNTFHQFLVFKVIYSIRKQHRDVTLDVFFDQVREPEQKVDILKESMSAVDEIILFAYIPSYSGE